MFVYIITHLRKGRYYIGITSNTSRRINQHKNSDSYLGRSVQKYGEDEFEMKIIAEFKTIPEAQKMEVELIKLYTGMGLELYNQSLGGEYRGFSNRNMLPVPDAVLNNTITPTQLESYIKYYRDGIVRDGYIIHNIKSERDEFIARNSNRYHSNIKHMIKHGLIDKHDTDHVEIKMSNYEKINFNFLMMYFDDIPTRLLRYAIMALLMKNRLFKEETLVKKLGVGDSKEQMRYMKARLREVCNIINLELEIVKEFGKEEYRYKTIEKRA